MSSATLLALLLVPQPYHQLPSEECCEAMFKVCEQDRVQLWHVLQVTPGWQATMLREYQDEAQRVQSIWYSAWWVTWLPATFEQREEWALRLSEQVGAEAFWRGELPLPLSMR